MTEAQAAAATATANPNVPVGEEVGVPRGGSNPYFFDEMPGQVNPKSKGKAEPKEPKKVEAKEKAEPKAKSAAKDEPKAKDVGDGEEKNPKKAKPDVTDEKAEGDDKEAKDEKGERKAKPKVHKVRSGDAVVDLSGDSIVTVQVDGKKEEVQVQDLIDQYSGKTDWSRKYSDLGKDREEHQKTVKSMNDMVNSLVAKASQDPNEGYDFLADLTGKDPVEFKMSMIRAQIDELLPIAQMSDAERETWLKDKERDFRDKKYERREKIEKETKAESEKRVALEKVRSTYGIDEESYAATEQSLRDHFKKTNQEVEIKPDDVIYAHRYVIAARTIDEVVPHLADHPKYDKIVSDVTRDLLEDPSLSKEAVAKVLVETFGSDDDKAGLKRLSKKARDRAEDSGDELPTKPRESKKPVFFDD